MASIKLTWQGEEATLSEDQAFLALDAVERVITFGELIVMRNDGGKLRFGQLSRAYAALLSEAGLTVKPRDVHKEFMSQIKNGEPAEKLALAREAIDWLLIIIMDGAPEADSEGEGDTQGNEPAPA